MELKDCRPGLQVIITEHVLSRTSIRADHSVGYYSSTPRYTFGLRNHQGILLNDRSETYEEYKKSIHPLTGKLCSIPVTKHKVSIMLTSGDKVYLRPSQIKILRSK